MIPSTAVAYRIYTFGEITKAILFNTRSRQFMFLEGLSAILLQKLIECTDQEVLAWAHLHELQKDDIDGFVGALDNFGVFSVPTDRDALAFHPNSNDTDAPASSSELNLFQNFLRVNNRYYCFHIDITNRCNEKCIHCYHPFQQYDHSQELSLKEIKNLIDIIYDLGVFVVTLSGGECLLRKDFFDILSYISEKGMMTNIFTNGMLLTPSVVEKIKNYRVNMVSISLYGDTPEIHDRITTISGSFEKTVAGINRLKEHGIPFELKCVVLDENIDRIERIRELSKKLNYGKDCKADFSLCGKLDGDCNNFSHRASIEKIRNVFYSDPDRYFGASEFFARQPNESPCGAGKFGLYCSADGNIYPCVSFRLFLCNYKDLPSIKNNTVFHQWCHTKISDFTDCFKHDYCKYCSEQCAGNNLIENGNYLDSRNISNCERAKIIAEWFMIHSENDK